MAERKISYREALNEALHQEMERDEAVIVMGEDISGAPHTEEPTDVWGGPLAVTKGLVHKFGRERVRDTPITESAFIGAGVGAAATGLSLRHRLTAKAGRPAETAGLRLIS